MPAWMLEVCIAQEKRLLAYFVGCMRFAVPSHKHESAVIAAKCVAYLNGYFAQRDGTPPTNCAEEEGE